MRTTRNLILTALLLIMGTSPTHAENDLTRVILYRHEGGGIRKNISIISLNGGPAFATITITSKDGKKETTGESSPENFKKLWEGFETIPTVKKAATTSKDSLANTETHHIFIVVEQSTSGLVKKGFAVPAKETEADFRSWLNLFETIRKGN